MNLVRSSKSNWVIDSRYSRILLELDNQLVDPGGLAVWDAQFAGISPPRMFPGRPADTITHLKFSRYLLDVSLKLEGSSIENLTISYVITKGREQHRLGEVISDQIIYNNTWYPLDESITEARKLLSNNNITVPGLINIGQLIWLRGKDRLPIPVIDEVNISLLETRSDIDLPELNADLFPYQKTGISFLARIAAESLGCILADEMGLGKTLQVIGLLVLEKKNDRGPNLVVCPATLLENWRRELQKFAPRNRVYTHAGNNRTGRASLFQETDVVLVSYETAVRDIVILSSLKWNLVVLDEAQNIKNPDAQRTITVKSLDRSVSIAVTGTPVENRLTDLWSIADFVLPDLLGDKSSFEGTFDNNVHDASLLAPLVAPILLRRRVLEVAKDLPPRLDIDQALEVSHQMAIEYERIRNEVIERYGNRGSLVAIGKLRQFCAHPRVLGLKNNTSIEDNPKYRRLLEVTDEIFSMGEKVLIFTSYLEMADLIITDFRERFRNAWIGSIDGRVEITTRQPLIDTFSEFEGPAALVLNPIAAGTGLNITAANHIIHYNPEWNPALEDQASARAYRRTQKRPVTVHHFFYANTVEEIIVERLEQKRILAQNAIVGHEGDQDLIEITKAMQISPLNQNNSI